MIIKHGNQEHVFIPRKPSVSDDEREAAKNRRKDVEWALTIIGLQAGSGRVFPDDQRWRIGEIVERVDALREPGSICLFRDDGDGTVTIEYPMNRDRLGNAGLLSTHCTMMLAPYRFVRSFQKMELMRILNPEGNDAVFIT